MVIDTSAAFIDETLTSPPNQTYYAWPLPFLTVMLVKIPFF